VAPCIGQCSIGWGIVQRSNEEAAFNRFVIPNSLLGGMDLQEADLVVLGVEGMILVGFFGAAGQGQIGSFGGGH
jgi:hypothetical protein